jgi:sugar-specific transcriptional regulator TrmB
MVKNKHFASNDIQKRLDDLLKQLKELKDLSAERRQKLLDALESQTVRNGIDWTCNVWHRPPSMGLNL